MKIELWQLIGIVGTLGILMAMLSFRWGYTEGKLEMIEAMLEVAAEEEEKEISND